MTDLKEVSPFTDIPNKELQTNQAWGIDTVDNIASLNLGGGTKVFRVNKSGLWLGASKFADAPFSIDINGKIVSKLLEGTAGITIDGANKTIIVNDGTNDRILIGYQSGGF